MALPKRRSTKRDISPASDLPEDQAANGEAYSRKELFVVAILLLLGIGLRLAFPSAMAVEHFDEGVYASNFWFGPELDYQYPMRRLYAPPLLPSCIEWSIIFDLAGKDSPRTLRQVAPMFPSLIAGCLTLLVAWKLSRDWFGKHAALATLQLAALSDIHALYSRTALTEAMLLLFFVSAVWMMWRAVSNSSYLHLGLAGLLTGLAWWTKYNGWLPLAVGFGGLVVAFVVDASCRKDWFRKIGFLLGIAAIAFAVWSPFLRELQSYGGYAEVAANHRQYVVGFGGWWSSLLQQQENLRQLSGWASCLAVGGAVLLASGSALNNKQSAIKLVTTAFALSVAAVWLGPALVLLVGSVLFGVRDLYLRCSGERTNSITDHLALYFLAAWVAGLLFATPLYHPYPRLTLPLIAGLWIAFGLAATRLTDLVVSTDSNGRISNRWKVTLAVSSVLLAMSLPSLIERQAPAWQSRRGWIPISQNIVTEVGNRTIAVRGNRDEAMVIVYGEPGLFFQLNVSGTQVFSPAADLSFISRTPHGNSVPIFLITGPHAERTAGFHEDLARHTAQLKQVATYEYVPSDLASLNQQTPSPRPERGGVVESERVTLYEVVSRSAIK